jgi:hypothetical protein
MTTLIMDRGIDWVSVLATIKDKESLQLMGRFASAQRTVLEAQVAQLKQVEDAIAGRVKSIR